MVLESVQSATRTNKTRAGNEENIGPQNVGCQETVDSLQKQGSMGNHRKQDLPRVAGRFSLVSRGLWHDREQMCFAVLEPDCGTISLWDYPPLASDRHDLDSNELMSFGKKGSLDCPPKKIKNLVLEMLTSIDSNPHFKSIFMFFEGSAVCCLKAQSQRVFDDWMQQLKIYSKS